MIQIVINNNLKKRKVEIEMSLIAIIILTMISSTTCYDIHVAYGKVIIPNSDNCTITVNDTKMEIYNGKVPGLHYGLIEYQCNHHHGYIISKPECYDCGVYCPQNDKLLNCRQFALPYFIGFLSSLLISVLLIFIILKYGVNWAESLYKRVKETKKRNRQNRYSEFLAKYNDNISKTHKSPSSTSLTNIALTTLTLTANRSYACDRTLFMHSNGQICDTFKCQNIDSYVFNIAIGKTICFNTPDRQLMKFQVTNTKEISFYQAIYHTSDYELNLESTSNCKQQGLCFKEYCYKDAKHPDFKNGTGIHAYDCEIEGLGCDFLCWHKYACTWYLWWLKELGTLGTVYKRTITMWSFDLLVTFKDILRRYEFNSEITQYDLDIGKLFSNDNIPINVNNIIKSELVNSNYVLKDGFELYYVSANDINVLTSATLGDYQISLDHKQKNYKKNEVICRTHGCKVICTAPEPSLKIFRNTLHKNKVENFNIIDEYYIKGYKTVPLSVNLNVGNVEFKNLFVEQASCDLNVLHTFGCIGCDRLPYATIQATKIVNQGVLPFTSNCTFNTKTLSCGTDINKLVPIAQYKICTIYIPNINKTLSVEFTYEFFGELSIMDDIYSHDNGFKGIITSISNNPAFLDTLTYGIFSFTGIGLVLSLLTKLLLRFIALRKVQQTETEIKNDNL